MNLRSKFIQSLIALASTVPVASTIVAATAEPAAAASKVSSSKVDYASNLSAKLNSVTPSDPIIFGQVWVRSDFVEIQPPLVPSPPVTVSAVEAFDLLTRA